jgi:hypothetical protein
MPIAINNSELPYSNVIFSYLDGTAGLTLFTQNGSLPRKHKKKTTKPSRTSIKNLNALSYLSYSNCGTSSSKNKQRSSYLLSQKAKEMTNR